MGWRESAAAAGLSPYDVLVRLIVDWPVGDGRRRPNNTDQLDRKYLMDPLVRERTDATIRLLSATIDSSQPQGHTT